MLIYLNNTQILIYSFKSNLKIVSFKSLKIHGLSKETLTFDTFIANHIYKKLKTKRQQYLNIIW